ncbi:NAD(P)H-dependent glycerol-3-phosphate dehydrogenase [Brevibacillus daliensis]|uniref:NAD(P)H-dependent glycerol-3-phosphate dehydrogenase n=1 Tax=Brevibacillus daliensis TaxID=2892995 RepID=UPI001E37098A|nr:NAD(P)H-dependent glycerol-3-phosphate dehydrogenase [Brevibacillus daliensis]
MALPTFQNNPVITIVGAGVMGTALAFHLAGEGTRPSRVRLLGTQWDAEILKVLEIERKCPRMSVDVPGALTFFTHEQRKEAVLDADMIIFAVSSAGLQDMLKELVGFCSNQHVLVGSITKGIDGKNSRTLAEMMQHTLNDMGRSDVPVVKLGGPLRAVEIAKGHPAEALFASESVAAAKQMSEYFVSPQFRAGVSADVTGVDLCASMKNVYAIAFGMAEGLYPDADNPKAGLMGQIAKELHILTLAYGGQADTVAGVAGIGDLYVTVSGGRNRTLGMYLGQGMTISEAKEALKGQTVEGYVAAHEAQSLLTSLEEQGKLDTKSELPLLVGLWEVLQGRQKAGEAMHTYWSTSAS